MNVVTNEAAGTQEAILDVLVIGTLLYVRPPPRASATFVRLMSYADGAAFPVREGRKCDQLPPARARIELAHEAHLSSGVQSAHLSASARSLLHPSWRSAYKAAKELALQL